MKILVLDNYDSFTYNLVHIIRELGYGDQMDIYRNDKITLEAVGKYDKILLSPGPGIPSEAGIMMDVIKKYGPEKSILGVCLGHQGIAEAYGAQLFNMDEVLHGHADRVILEETKSPLFKDVPGEFGICLYHSWAVEAGSMNDQLKITARNEKGGVLALEHAEYKVYGVQFHPESILTENGKQILLNWLNL